MPLLFLATLLTIIPLRQAQASNESCLSQAVYLESGNQSFTGMIAVAHVTISRAKYFHESICATIRRRGAYSWFNGRNQTTRWNVNVSIRHLYANAAARIAMQDADTDPTNGAMFFHHRRIRHNCSVRQDRPFWCNMIRELVIQDHVFYRMPRHAN